MDHSDIVGEIAGNIGDALSCATLVAVIAQFLPSIAALFTIVWTGIRVYEWWMQKHRE